jgi:two-component system phosphate regulon response regulator PhoB
VARVLAVLRPKQHVDRSGALAFDGLELNSVTARVSARGDLINLRGAEYRLLEFLMAHAGRTFSREQLVSQVWGQDGGVDVRTVDVIVQRLRKILTDPGYRHHIQSVRGFGYRFRGPAAGLLPPNRDAARKT